MDMTKIDIATATPLVETPPAGVSTSLGLLVLVVALPVLAVRFVAEMLWRDVRATLRFARVCGEEVLLAMRLR